MQTVRKHEFQLERHHISFDFEVTGWRLRSRFRYEQYGYYRSNVGAIHVYGTADHPVCQVDISIPVVCSSISPVCSL